MCGKPPENYAINTRAAPSNVHEPMANVAIPPAGVEPVGVGLGVLLTE